jgi:hypothetical protein
MIQVALQVGQGYKSLHVISEEDMTALKNYKENQILRATLVGVQKPRSHEQLKLYWACCRTVASNLEGKSKEDIDFEVKVALKHIRAFRVTGGVTMVEVGSISFAELNHLDACNFFDRAFPALAKMIGVTTEELIRNVV